MSALTKCHMQADCNYANCQYASCNFASCHYANSDYANCHNYANCKYVNCQYADCQYVDWQYADCQYADCHYANSGQLSYTIFWAGVTALRRRWLSHPDPANRMSFAEVQYKLRQHHNTIIVNSNFFLFIAQVNPRGKWSPRVRTLWRPQRHGHRKWRRQPPTATSMEPWRTAGGCRRHPHHSDGPESMLFLSLLLRYNHIMSLRQELYNSFNLINSLMIYYF